MLKILNTILFVACENSDGLMGFYYSHDGEWNDKTYVGYKTKMQCANTCMERKSCVAITWFFRPYAGGCFHFSNRADLVSSNEVINLSAKAYIKCLGTDV